MKEALVMRTFKHLFAKTISLILCVSLLVCATVVPVMAAKPRTTNHSAALTIEKMAGDILTYLENAKIPELLPENSSLAGFEGFSDIGKITFSVDLASFGTNAKADISLHYDTVSKRYAADITATLPNRAPFYASLYLDTKMLAVNCNELFGSNTYAVEWDTPEKMLDKFASSNFAKALGVTDKDIEAVKQSEVWQKFISPEFAQKWNSLFVSYKNYVSGAENLGKAMCAKASVTEESFKETAVYAAKLNLATPEFKEVLEKQFKEYTTVLERFAALAGESETLNEEDLQKALNVAEKIFENTDITYYLDREKLNMAGFTANMALDLKGDGEDTYQVKMEGDFADGYKIRVEILPIGAETAEPLVFDLGLSVNAAYKHAVWEAYLKQSYLTVTRNITATFDWDEANKAYTLTVKDGISQGDNKLPETVYQFAGGLAVSETSFAVSLDSLSVHEPAILLPLSETESVVLRAERERVQPLGLSFSYTAAEPVKAPNTYKNLLNLSEDEVYALIARVTLNAQRLANDFNKAIGVALYDESDDPRVKKLYAIDYDDYEDYAAWYSEEEFWQLVEEYQYHIDNNASY